MSSVGRGISASSTSTKSRTPWALCQEICSMPKTREVLTSASLHLQGLAGHVFDLLTISKPVSPDAAVNLSKVVSKLSPLLGNLIEFNMVEFLNNQPEYRGLGEWKRQDPGFPDTIFVSPKVSPSPGIEIRPGFLSLRRSLHDSRTVRITLKRTRLISACWRGYLII